MTGKPYAMRLVTGMRRPKNRVPGRDVAGIVTGIGSAVTRFTIGEEAYGVAPGSFAEYAVGLETQLARKPTNLSFAQAAVVPVSAATALRALVDVGRVQSGQSVLVLGASGGVGTYAVQLAKASEPRSRASAAPPRPTWSPHWGPTMSLTTPVTTSRTGRDLRPGAGHRWQPLADAAAAGHHAPRDRRLHRRRGLWRHHWDGGQLVGRWSPLS